MPPGWEEGYDRASGRVYFINHIEKKTSWTHPVTGQTKMIQPVTASLPLQPNYGSAPPATQNAYPPHLTQSLAHPGVQPAPMTVGRGAPLTGMGMGMGMGMGGGMGVVPPVGASSHVASQFAQQQTISLSVAKPQWNTEQETNHCFKCNSEIGGFFKRKRVSLSIPFCSIATRSSLQRYSAFSSIATLISLQLTFCWRASLLPPTQNPACTPPFLSLLFALQPFAFLCFGWCSCCQVGHVQTPIR